MIHTDRDYGSLIAYRFLDTVGDTSGTIAANGNYSVSVPGIFKLQAPADQDLILGEFVISISAGGTWGQARYGNITTITTGPAITLHNSAGILLRTFFPQLPLINVGRMLAHADRHELFDVGSGRTITFHWQLFNVQPLYLRKGQYIQVKLVENFSALDAHLFKFNTVNEDAAS